MYGENHTAVIIAAAGAGKRMGMGEINKVYLCLEGEPVLARTIRAFEEHPYVDEIVVAVRRQDEDLCRALIKEKGFKKIGGCVIGGKERQDTVGLALERVSEKARLVLVHDGARPFVQAETITEVIKAACQTGAAVAAVPVKDTIKIAGAPERDEGESRREIQVEKTPDRNRLWAAQTPQGFRKEILQRALKKAEAEGFYATDEGALAEKIGEKVFIVQGKYDNIKVTTYEDLAAGKAILQGRKERKEKLPLREKKGEGNSVRVGIGYDVHRLAEGRALILGGVAIPWKKGLAGHSDGDVLVHSVMDALLGACALGDIGKLFPDTDPAYKDISSLKLLSRVKDRLAHEGFRICNIDATVIAQAPRLSGSTRQMEENIAQALGIHGGQVSVKATTTEHLGFEGRGEGIAAMATAAVEDLPEKD